MNDWAQGDAGTSRDVERRLLAQLSTLYLLGLRGDELAARAPEKRAARIEALLTGLCSADRNVRARSLAHGLCDLLAELEARRLDNAC